MLQIWPVFVLGRRFSGLVAIQPEFTLVTSGIHGTIRHPSYLGTARQLTGVALPFRSGVGVLLRGVDPPPGDARCDAPGTEVPALLERLGRHRWVVERTFAWLLGCRRLGVRYERRADLFQSMLHLACALICVRFLARTYP